MSENEQKPSENIEEEYDYVPPSPYPTLQNAAEIVASDSQYQKINPLINTDLQFTKLDKQDKLALLQKLRCLTLTSNLLIRIIKWEKESRKLEFVIPSPKEMVEKHTSLSLTVADISSIASVSASLDGWKLETMITKKAKRKRNRGLFGRHQKEPDQEQGDYYVAE